MKGWSQGNGLSREILLVDRYVTGLRLPSTLIAVPVT